MDDTAKYLIHADLVAEGVIERSDVVGAVYGQTEGLLGDDLDLRDLQRASKVGRIDVRVQSHEGRSTGEITIASALDRVETAILGAALETIDRVGPCRSTIEVTEIEDVRQAKRRAVVDRAKELLATAFDEDLMSSAELVEEVRESVRVERVTEYEGLPAGPRVESGDAIIVVEGRADVQTLLGYGIKNAVAVEGTDVPGAVADLTRERTTTAFLDGDRGGELVLRELAQVGAVDYVAFAPENRSVEDLDRSEALAALREKVPFEGWLAEADGEEVTPVTDGSAAPVEPPVAEPGGESGADAEPGADGPATLPEHVAAVVGAESGTARFLDEAFGVLAEVPADEAFDALEAADPVPATVVLDDTLSQRLLDVAAQRGVGGIVAREEGEFTKRPTGVRVRTAADLEAA